MACPSRNVLLAEKMITHDLMLFRVAVRELAAPSPNWSESEYLVLHVRAVSQGKRILWDVLRVVYACVHVLQRHKSICIYLRIRVFHICGW